LGKISIADFLKEHLGTSAGPVVTAEGATVGRHEGAYLYTIGQRHGLSLGSTQAALRSSGSKSTRPFYVTGKDVASNTVTVAQGDDHPALFCSQVSLVQGHWIGGTVPQLPASVFTRVRYRQPLAPATLIRRGRGLELVFELPQKFVSPGQSAVWYEKTKQGFSVLGGGVIV
jgi:tRNA-specific 2-thiouridylase